MIKRITKKPEESTCSTSQDADVDCKDEDEQPRKKCQTLTPPELRIFYEMLYDGLDQYMSPSINGKGKVKRQRLMAEIATALNAIPNNIQRTPNQIFERAKQIFKRINERINYEKAAETGDFTSFRNVQIPNDMMALYEKEKDRQMRESENGETQAEELDSSYYDHTMFSTNTLLDIIVKEEPEASCSIQSASNSTPQPSMTALEFHDFHDHDRIEKRRSEAEYMEATRDHGDSQKRKKRKREDDQEQPPEPQQPLSIEEKRLKIVDKELEYWDVKIATEKRKLEVLSKMNHYMNFLMVHSSPSPNGNVGQLKSLLNLSSISSILV